MKPLLSMVALVSVMFAASAATAQEKKPAAAPPAAAVGATMTTHLMVTPADVKWSDGPPSLPAGAKMAVIEGDPALPNALFTLRLKLPADYKVMPHFHPADEHITVISGAFWMGMGGTHDVAKLKELPTGAFAVMPVGHSHFAMTKAETVVQIHAVGPWGITYVNPADDPRRAKK